MDAPKTLIIKVYRHFMHDSLYRNSVFLILDTAILALFGLFFWALAARYYSVHDIGVTATLISTAGLITLLSALGFDSTLIRYLARSKDTKNLIDTVFSITGIVAIAVTILYLLIVSVFRTSALFIHSSFLYYVLFVILMVVNLWNNVSNNIFIAYRKSHYIVIINLAFSVLRLVLLVLLVTFGLNGILLSQFAGIAISLVLTFIVLKRVFQYKYTPNIDISKLIEFRSYASNSYISNTLSSVPNLLLPTILFITVGPKFAAYYYIVNTLVYSLNIIPYATSQSLFSEGSLDSVNLKLHVVKSVKIVAYSLVPSAVILAIFGSFILNIFGKVYADNGHILLLLITLSMIPRAANYILSTVLRINHKLRQLSFVYATYSIIILAGSFVSMRARADLTYLGIVMVSAEVITTIILANIVIKSRMLTTT